MITAHMYPGHIPPDDGEPFKVAPVPVVSPPATIRPSDRFVPDHEDAQREGTPQTSWLCKQVILARLEDSLVDLARLFDANQISGAPVVDEQGHLVGVVSQADIAHHLASVKSPEPRSSTGFYHGMRCQPLYAEPAAQGILERSKVSDILTPHTYQVEAGASVEAIVDLMLEHDVHRLPVVDAGRLVGMVTTLDVLRHLRYGGR